MILLKQSTAATIKLGPFLDDTDGKTPKTALSIGQADIRISKAGGDYAQTNNAAGATHDENGEYDVPLNATDTGTLGQLRVMVMKSGALPVWRDFMVVPANVFDSVVLGTDELTVDSAAIALAVGNDVYDGSYSLRQLIRGLSAVLLGKAAGMGSNTGTFRNLGDSKNRVTATQDASGNRTAITLDLD